MAGGPVQILADLTAFRLAGSKTELAAEFAGCLDQTHLVAALSGDQLDALLADEALVAGVVEASSALDAAMTTAVTDPDVVYFSLEFGISELVKQLDPAI